MKGIGRAVTGSPPFWVLLACGLCAAWPLAGIAAALFGVVLWLAAWAARLLRRALAERREEAR